MTAQSGKKNIHSDDVMHEKPRIDKKRLLALQKVRKNYEVDDPIATVLLVEDQPLAAHVARQLLQDHQCASDLAETGKEALAKVKQKHYDLILMDIGLPDVDGIAVTRSIRLDIDAETTPIVALTAHAAAEQRECCLQAGMQDIFTKPLNAAGLKRALRIYVFLLEDVDQEPSVTTWNFSPEILPPKTIDLEEGARLVGQGIEDAKEMIFVIAEKLSLDIQKIKQVASLGNKKELYELVHGLYGALCYCGLPRLRALIAQLKEKLLDKEVELIDNQLVEQIAIEVEHVISESKQL